MFRRRHILIVRERLGKGSCYENRDSLSLSLSLSAFASGSVTTDLIARTGDPAIGIPTIPFPMVWSDLCLDAGAKHPFPVVNQAGQVAFLGYTDYSIFGIWRSSSTGVSLIDNDYSARGVAVDSSLAGSIDLVWRTRDIAPFLTGGGSVVFNPFLNGNVAVTEEAIVAGPLLGSIGSFYSSIEYRADNLASNLLEVGATAEGEGASPSVLYEILGGNGSQPLGLYSNRVALFPSGAYPGCSGFEPYLQWGQGARTGSVVASAALSNGSGDFLNAIWRGVPGSMSLVARSDGAFPGLPTGAQVLLFDHATTGEAEERLIGYNDQGTVSFIGRGVLASGGDFSTLWLAPETGVMVRIAGSGDPLAGMPGAVIANIRQHSLSNNDAIAYAVDYSTSSGIGCAIVLRHNGVSRLILTSNDVLPGAESLLAIDFDELSFSVNSLGWVAAIATFTDSTSAGNQRGLWVFDGVAWNLIARTNAPFVVGPSDTRTPDLVCATLFSGGHDGRRSAFNDAGQITFALGFTDGSEGVFLSRVTCPADFNEDGFLDFTDVDDFTSAYEAGLADVDFNRDGFLDFTDVGAFVEAYEAGC